MFKFYEVDSKYIKYLKDNGDDKIPNIEYKKHSPIEYLSQKDFSKEDKKYQILLRKELHYCNINSEKIKKLANQVYKLGLNSKTREKFNICNFSELEVKCLEYLSLKNQPK